MPSSQPVSLPGEVVLVGPALGARARDVAGQAPLDHPAEQVVAVLARIAEAVRPRQDRAQQRVRWLVVVDHAQVDRLERCIPLVDPLVDHAPGSVESAGHLLADAVLGPGQVAEAVVGPVAGGLQGGRLAPELGADQAIPRVIDEIRPVGHGAVRGRAGLPLLDVVDARYDAQNVAHEDLGVTRGTEQAILATHRAPQVVVAERPAAPVAIDDRGDPERPVVGQRRRPRGREPRCRDRLGEYAAQVIQRPRGGLLQDGRADRADSVLAARDPVLVVADEEDVLLSGQMDPLRPAPGVQPIDGPFEPGRFHYARQHAIGVVAVLLDRPGRSVELAAPLVEPAVVVDQVDGLPAAGGPHAHEPVVEVVLVGRRQPLRRGLVEPGDVGQVLPRPPEVVEHSHALQLRPRVRGPLVVVGGLFGDGDLPESVVFELEGGPVRGAGAAAACRGQDALAQQADVVVDERRGPALLVGQAGEPTHAGVAEGPPRHDRCALVGVDPVDEEVVGLRGARAELEPHPVAAGAAAVHLEGAFLPPHHAALAVLLQREQLGPGEGPGDPVAAVGGVESEGVHAGFAERIRVAGQPRREAVVQVVPGAVGPGPDLLRRALSDRHDPGRRDQPAAFRVVGDGVFDPGRQRHLAQLATAAVPGVAPDQGAVVVRIVGRAGVVGARELLDPRHPPLAGRRPEGRVEVVLARDSARVGPDHASGLRIGESVHALALARQRRGLADAQHRGTPRNRRVVDDLELQPRQAGRFVVNPLDQVAGAHVRVARDQLAGEGLLRLVAAAAILVVDEGARRLAHALQTVGRRGLVLEDDVERRPVVRPGAGDRHPGHAPGRTERRPRQRVDEAPRVSDRPEAALAVVGEHDLPVRREEVAAVDPRQHLVAAGVRLPRVLVPRAVRPLAEPDRRDLSVEVVVLEHQPRACLTVVDPVNDRFVQGADDIRGLRDLRVRPPHAMLVDAGDGLALLVRGDDQVTPARAPARPERIVGGGHAVAGDPPGVDLMAAVGNGDRERVRVVEAEHLEQAALLPELPAGRQDRSAATRDQRQRGAQLRPQEGVGLRTPRCHCFARERADHGGREQVGERAEAHRRRILHAAHADPLRGSSRAVAALGERG